VHGIGQPAPHAAFARPPITFYATVRAGGLRPSMPPVPVLFSAANFARFRHDKSGLLRRPIIPAHLRDVAERLPVASSRRAVTATTTSSPRSMLNGFFRLRQVGPGRAARRCARRHSLGNGAGGRRVRRQPSRRSGMVAVRLLRLHASVYSRSATASVDEQARRRTVRDFRLVRRAQNAGFYSTSSSVLEPRDIR